jgi:hypothetical protein
MLDDKILEKLVSNRKATKNILALESDGFDDGKTVWTVACAQLRAIAQNLIEHVDDHYPLRTAKILLLVKSSESQKAKLEAGQPGVIGKACKANPQMKLLSRIGRGTEQMADFVVWLNGDWLDACDATQSRGTECTLDGFTEGLAKAAALIDHELMHCSAKIAGVFVAPDLVDEFVQDFGKDYIETCTDITRSKDDAVLIRYFTKNKSGGYDFKMRKHDVEEFTGIVERHGAWDRRLQRLVDVIEELEPTLFAGAK